MAKHMTMEEFVLLLKLQGITVTIYETRTERKKIKVTAVKLSMGSSTLWKYRFIDTFQKNGYYLTEYGRLPTLDLVYEKIQAHLTSDN